MEGLAEVFVVEEQGYFLKGAVEFVEGCGGIDVGEALSRDLGEDVCGFVPRCVFQGEVCVTQSGEV